MLIRFSSVETQSITLFGDIAMKLITMMGASGTIPGAIGAEDIPAAVQRLRQQLNAAAKTDTENMEGDQDEKDRELPVALATRAGPLIDILERAAAAKAPVMWEKA